MATFGFLFFYKNAEKLTKKGYLYIYPSNKDNIYYFDNLEHQIIKTIIYQTQSLPFLTNLTDDEIIKINTDLKKIYNQTLNLKNKDFFGVECQEIQLDLGLNILNEKNIFKIFTIYKKILKFLQTKYENFDDLCKSDSFIKNVSKNFYPNKKIINNQDIKLNQIYNFCYQPIINCNYDNKINNKDKIEIVIRRNRYIHAQDLLNCTFPTGNIQHITQEQLNKINDPLLWILSKKENSNLSKFALIKTNISHITPKLKGILGFKSLNQNQFQVKDEWLTSLETQFYSKYAKLDIKEVYLWEQIGKLNIEKNNIQNFLNDNDPLLSLSLTYQYLAQIYLKILNYAEKRVNNNIEIGGVNTDIRTIWQLSYNKIIMATMVELLYKQFDIQVKEYGIGYIKLYVNQDEFNTIKELVKNSGWSFPLSNYPQENQNYLNNIL